jgi:tetratricopeptide (TPR) repeat protein
LSHHEKRSRRPPRWPFWLTAGVVLFVLGVVFGRQSLLFLYHLHQGRNALVARDLDVALDHLKFAVDLNGEHGEARFYLARASRLSGDKESMEENLRKSLQLGFSEKRIKAEECFALAQSGQFLTIHRQIQSLFLDPGDDGRELCESVAVGYLQTFQVSQALAIVEAWKRDYPEDSRPWLVEGVYFAEGALWVKALASFEGGLKVVADDPEILFQRGRALLELNRLAEAAATFEQCLQYNGDDVEYLAALAMVKFKSGHSPQATLLTEKALKIAPYHFDSLCLLGQIHLAENRPDQALSLLGEAYSMKPFDPVARYHYAMALRRTGSSAKADEILATSEEQHKAQSQLRGMFSQLAADPQDAQIRIAIGRILLAHGDPAEGIAILKSALLFDPQNTEAHSLIESAIQSQPEKLLLPDDSESKKISVDL